MTYCVAMRVDSGLAFCSDSRTNAGVDQLGTYSKMFQHVVPGERVITVLSAGNLATTQAVVTRIKRDLADGLMPNLNTFTTISDAADYIGALSLGEQRKHAGATGFEASFIVGGQIQGEPPWLCMVYPEGNHITTSDDTRFLQIGESKYGKPLLDRVLTPETPVNTAAMAALVSMGSTLRSNLTVGPPIELLVYDTDSFSGAKYVRFDGENDYFKDLNQAWDQAIKEAFAKLPALMLATESGAPPVFQQAAQQPPFTPGQSSQGNPGGGNQQR